MSSSGSSGLFQQLKDFIVDLTPDEQEELYQYLRKLLHHDSDASSASFVSSAVSRSLPLAPSDDWEEDDNSSSMIKKEVQVKKERIEVSTSGDSDDDSDDDDDAPVVKSPHKASARVVHGHGPSPKKKNEGVPGIEDPEWKETMTDFNPDTAKNVLQQYYQTFIHPSMTPTYIRGFGYSEVRFQAHRGGPEISIKGYGKKATEEEKNAALRAIVYLEKNNPNFQRLRLPSNARVQRNLAEAGQSVPAFSGVPSSDSVKGLTELNAANFLFYCRDVGKLLSVVRTPCTVTGGGFSGYTKVVTSNGYSSEFKSPMFGRKKDAQNASDLLAAQWVVKNLHISVPSAMASV